MSSIQERKSSICLSVLLIVLLESTLVYKSISSQGICENSDTRTISYFIIGKNGIQVEWNEAWKLCNIHGSTLPVICNQQEQATLTDFLNSNIHVTRSSAVWTSGRKISFGGWIWVDGQTFISSETIPVQSETYTHVLLNRNQNYSAQNPFSEDYYLCQYSGSLCNSENAINVTNGCVLRSYDYRTWYRARNRCITNGGDLAILTYADLAILKTSNKLDASNTYWIGLRKNVWQWSWQTAEPPHNTDDEIKYSDWSNDSNSLNGDCIFIDARDGRWKSVTCTDKRKVVCQRNGTTPSSLPYMARTMSGTILSTATRAMSSMSEDATPSTKNNDYQVLLYSGVGTGLGIFFIIVIVVALRYARRHDKDFKVRGNSEKNRLDVSPNKRVSSIVNATVIVPLTGADDTKGVYAEISLATLNRLEDVAEPQQPGIVYASLDFQKEPAYQELE